MQTVTVVAFDPGETIGWSAMTVEPSCLTNVESHPSLSGCVRDWIWKWGQIDAKHLGSNNAGIGADRGHAALNLVGENIAVMNMLALTENAYPNCAVALEKFVLDPKLANSKYDLLSPVRIISAYSFGMHMQWLDIQNQSVDFDVKRDPLERIYLINRGDPKRTCTDERLTHWRLNPDGGHANRHARDATRIAYYFLRDCRGGSYKAAEARWRAWPHIFPDPALTHPDAKVGPKRRKMAPKPKGERI